MSNPANPQPDSTGFVGTVSGVVMNLPAPFPTEAGSQNLPFVIKNPTSVAPVFNAGQPGGAAYEDLATVANSQDSQGKVVQVVSDASGNSVHFNNPLPPQSPALQASSDSTHAVPAPVWKNPA